MLAKRVLHLTGLLLLLGTLEACVIVRGTPVNLPARLEPQRDQYEASLDVAFARVGKFSAKYGWRSKAKDLCTDFEVFETQAALWKRILELADIDPDTPLPATGLAATMDGGHLLAVAPAEYRRLHPEYARSEEAWEQLLAHELVHALHVDILQGDDDAMGPVWFYEGFAVVGAGQPFGNERRFSSNAEALAAVGDLGDRPEGSYAVYAAVVRHFIGKTKLQTLISRAKGSDFENWLGSLK